MHTVAQRLFPLIASLMIVGLLAAAGPRFSLPPETARLSPSPGAELLNSQCLLCHSADYISTQPRLSAAQWRAVVVKMQTKYGAPVATNNVDALVDYLTKNYGNGTVTNAPPSAK